MPDGTAQKVRRQEQATSMQKPSSSRSERRCRGLTATGPSRPHRHEREQSKLRLDAKWANGSYAR